MNINFIYTPTMVRFYDIVTQEIVKYDRGFYLNEILKTKGKVLEIGTGTGRIFKKALDLGCDVYGIDISESMQKYLKEHIKSEEHYRLKFADIKDFDFGFKFDLIVAPFRMFSHLISTSEQLLALRNISKQLKTDGKFLFDVFIPNLDMIKNVSEIKLRFEGEYEPGKCVKWYDAAVPDYINQIQHVTFKYVWEENGTREEIVEFPFRYFFRYELEHLIARSGLILEKMYGDFEYGEMNSKSGNMVCVCKSQNLDL